MVREEVVNVNRTNLAIGALLAASFVSSVASGWRLSSARASHRSAAAAAADAADVANEIVELRRNARVAAVADDFNAEDCIRGVLEEAGSVWKGVSATRRGEGRIEGPILRSLLSVGPVEATLGEVGDVAQALSDRCATAIMIGLSLKASPTNEPGRERWTTTLTLEVVEAAEK